MVGAALVGTGAAVVETPGAVVAGATVIAIDGAGVGVTLGSALGVGEAPTVGAPGRMSRMSRPNAISAISAAVRNAASWTLDAVALLLPPKVQLARRCHVSEQRG